jgi:hypothetical protein
MNNEPRAGRAAWPCIATGAAGALFTILCFYPGYMSPDSFEQLRQARSGQFTDWHPPLMSLLWRMLDKIYPGPAPMLVVHNVVFWGAVTLLCWTLVRRAGPLAIVAFGLFPPVIALLSTIWKDVGFGASLLLTYALLVYALDQRSKLAWWASLLPLFYGIAVRHNAVLAAIPLSLFAGYVWTRNFRNTSLVRSTVIIGIALVLSTYALVASFNALLVRDRKMYIYQTILIHDLVAISIAEGKVHLPAWTYGNGPPPSLTELQKIYHHDTLVPLFCGEPSTRLLQQSTNHDDIMKLWNVWLPAVRQNPGAYLRHRWNAFKALIGLQEVVCFPYCFGVEANDLGVSFHPSAVNKVVMNVLERLNNTILFRTWFYLLLIVLALGATPWLWRDLRLSVVVLGTSALLNQTLYFFAVPTCDFRYNWWCVLATLCILLHWISRWRTVKTQDGRS